MKFVPSAVKTEVMLARFLKRMLKFTTKSLHVVKFISKSMISSEDIQVKVHGDFLVPCRTTRV